MSENKTPMFVKVYMPENDRIDKKELISLWGSPQSKDFHIIDNPSVINRIANQFDNSRRPYSSVKPMAQSSENLKTQKPLYIVKKIKNNAQRLKFGKLSQQVNCLSDFIENQVSDLNQAQIFLYKQKMLITFLSDFFQELQKQCHEKATFIKQIWNQMISLFDRVFTIQNKKSLKQEKNSLNEILTVHKSYQEMFDKLKKEIKTLQQEGQKHKELIKSLVINLKQRKKEIKVYQGGINEYNYKINSLNAQFSELKKEHLDILMYGHHGNMTRLQAQQMLMAILKPLDEDEVDLRNDITIKYIPPRMKKGKSNRYLHYDKQGGQSLENSVTKLDEEFSVQNSRIEDELEVNHYELNNNFLPQKVKLEKIQKTHDVKVQTDYETITSQKKSTFVSCNYFEKMGSLIIKNKYCQTETKKPQRNNEGIQTDLTGNQSLFQIKVSKLSVFSNVYEYSIELKYCRTFKNLKVLSSRKNLDHSNLQSQGKSPDVKEQKQLKSHDSSKNCSKQKKLESAHEKNENLGRLSHKSSHKNLKMSAKKSKIALRNITQQSQTGFKTIIKTQNFVRLNKARISGEFKNMLMDFVDSYYRSNLPECSDLQKCVLLLRSYISNQDELANQVIQQMNTSILFNKNWSKTIFDVIKKIRDGSLNEQMLLSFYYRTKIYKNRNIVQQNCEYISKIKDLIENLELNGVSKRKGILSGGNYIGTFTVKKCYKIIGEVFELCFKIRSQSKIVNINLIKILQKVLHPSSLQFTKEPIQAPNQVEDFQRTVQFLSFLIRNVNENYLFKNILFLCGVSYNLQPENRNETGVFNLNKNVSITEEKQTTKKSVPIGTKNQLFQQQSKDSQKKSLGTMTYSTEVIFYLDMLQVLNCDLSGEFDLMNFYTTLEVLQQNFQKLSKYYRDFKLINNIKKFIQDSVKHSMINNSKLNIFKCLQIFLDAIRERKVEMFKSFQNFYQFVANKEKQQINQTLLLDVLNVLKAPRQTQLKIISNFFKNFQSQPSFQDMITLFTIEGFPEFDVIQKDVLKNKDDISLLYLKNMEKPSNIVLDYVFSKISKSKDLILARNLQNVTKSLIADHIIEKNVDQIVGQNLNLLDLSWIFLTHQK